MARPRINRSEARKAKRRQVQAESQFLRSLRSPQEQMQMLIDRGHGNTGKNLGAANREFARLSKQIQNTPKE